jgi:hypothetical protein
MQPTYQEIANYIIAHPRKYDASELADHFQVKNYKVHRTARKYAIQDLVLKAITKPRVNKLSPTPELYLQPRPGSVEKELNIVESIKNGENMFSIQKRLSISFHTLKHILQKHGLEQYRKSNLQLVLKKQFLDLVLTNLNFFIEKDLALQLNIGYDKVRRLSRKYQVTDLIKNDISESIQKQQKFLNAIPNLARKEFVQVARAHNLPDRLIADKLGITKQRVNQLRLELKREQSSGIATN